MRNSKCENRSQSGQPERLDVGPSSLHGSAQEMCSQDGRTTTSPADSLAQSARPDCGAGFQPAQLHGPTPGAGWVETFNPPTGAARSRGQGGRRGAVSPADEAGARRTMSRGAWRGGNQGWPTAVCWWRWVAAPTGREQLSTFSPALNGYTTISSARFFFCLSAPNTSNITHRVGGEAAMTPVPESRTPNPEIGRIGIESPLYP